MLFLTAEILWRIRKLVIVTGIKREKLLRRRKEGSRLSSFYIESTTLKTRVSVESLIDT